MQTKDTAASERQIKGTEGTQIREHRINVQSATLIFILMVGWRDAGEKTPLHGLFSHLPQSTTRTFAWQTLSSTFPLIYYLTRAGDQTTAPLFSRWAPAISPDEQWPTVFRLQMNWSSAAKSSFLCDQCRTETATTSYKATKWISSSKASADNQLKDLMFGFDKVFMQYLDLRDAQVRHRM